MIYTASYFQPENFGPGRLVSVSIQCPHVAAMDDTKRELVTLEHLQPTWGLVNRFRDGYINEKEYCEVYLEMLEERYPGENWNAILSGKLGPSILDEFWLEDGDSLLCYEWWPNFCHRYIIADLLKLNGIEISKK